MTSRPTVGHMASPNRWIVAQACARAAACYLRILRRDRGYCGSICQVHSRAEAFQQILP